MQYPDAAFSRQPPRRKPAAAWAILFAVVVGGAVFASGTAPQPTGTDAPGVREVVQSQLNALAADDAGKAFALADPALRTKFGSAEAFLAVVHSEYPMVLNPASVLFLKPHSDGTIALQKVRLTDSEGSNWLVTYLLNRQSDHQWKISGALIEPDGTQVVT